MHFHECSWTLTNIHIPFTSLHIVHGGEGQWTNPRINSIVFWLWRNSYEHGKESALTPLMWKWIQEHVSWRIFHKSETSHSCSICLNRHLFSEWNYLVKMLWKQQRQVSLYQRFVSRVLYIAEHPQMWQQSSAQDFLFLC